MLAGLHKTDIRVHRITAASLPPVSLDLERPGARFKEYLTAEEARLLAGRLLDAANEADSHQLREVA